MPGDEINPNPQPAGVSAGAGGNVIPSVAGIPQAEGGVPDPTLQAIGNLQTAYNANGGPPAERGGGRNGAEHAVVVLYNMNIINRSKPHSLKSFPFSLLVFIMR